MAQALVPPHGGTLVNRTTTDPAALKQKAASLPKVPVSAADLSTVYRIGDGTLSPLTGFMTRKAYDRVLDQRVVEANGKTLAWTIPLSLPLTAEQAQSVNAGQAIALTNPQGEVVAVMQVADVFEWDKPRYLKAVYGTDRTDHPGADMVLKNDADKTHLAGGEIEVLPQPKNPAFGQYVLSPVQTRELVAHKGWDAVVAFQTRNPLHRAHEYALVYGLETLLRQGKNAGAVLNPLVGETKGDDVNAEIRMQTYERLIQKREMGDGDSDPALWAQRNGESVPDRVILLGVDIKMFYGGPSEAVMHAIYRQNMGFTHIIIGRKHADAPFHDGSPIWGDFDAQEVFDDLGGELHIKPLKVGFAAYYASINRVDLMENHKDEKPVFISGKEVRATLQRGEQVDPRIMRPSTSEILAAAMKQ
jgi:sulfate adenylyltransferase